MLYIGIIITILIIIAVSIFSSHYVKSGTDFDTGGRKAGSIVVSGAILGTIAGGSSTVGTAQLAYDYGMSAWWFTLGSGIACLILAFLYVKPLRDSAQNTIIGIIGNEYGKKVRTFASVLSSIGTFINILSQMISATAIFAIVFPSMSDKAYIAGVTVLMVLYAVFGGVLGAGVVGIVKTALIYLAVIIGSVTVLRRCNGIGILYDTLDHQKYFNLFARGLGKDGSACLSLIIGVLSTQSYAQAILAGRTDEESKKGALISAFMIPPVGIGGILIGMYMKVCCPDLGSAKMAFPRFVTDNVPPILAGVILAVLLIAVVGTGSGLALGISSIIKNDIIKSRTSNSKKEDSLLLSRAIVTLILILAAIVCILPIGDTILNFAFMSMGLRGTVIFIPLICALWLKGKVDSNWILAAVIISPILVLIFTLNGNTAIDPLFIGMAASAMFCIAGLIIHKKQTKAKI